jgi:hypothetical protein
VVKIIQKVIQTNLKDNLKLSLTKTKYTKMSEDDPIYLSPFAPITRIKNLKQPEFITVTVLEDGEMKEIVIPWKKIV